jgi:predicted transcriptional regulator
MLQSAQIRSARALLGWNQYALAKAADVSIATIRRIEGREGIVSGYVSTLVRIQTALEDAGVRFLDDDHDGGIGVRLSASKART